MNKQMLWMPALMLGAAGIVGAQAPAQARAQAPRAWLPTKSA